MLETTFPAVKTITLPIQTVAGFKPPIRAQLRNKLSPVLAPKDAPLAISIPDKSARTDRRRTYWIYDPESRSYRQLSGQHAAVEAFAASLDIGSALEADRSLANRPWQSDFLDQYAPTQCFEIICLPQGALIVPRNPVNTLEVYAQYRGTDEITPEIVRSVFEVVEGQDTSNHERLELIAAGTAFLEVFLAQEYAAAPELTHTPIRLRVGAPA